ncbi:hypothetical protein HDV06_003957 [Boothiomyces sp. JEL0866]|nr:hypothetical protein HDV06_003957 [Boothiomyces sp. JEL0866]
MIERVIQMIANLPDKITLQSLIPILKELESLGIDNAQLIRYLTNFKVQIWIFDPLNKYKISQLIEIIDDILSDDPYHDYSYAYQMENNQQSKESFFNDEAKPAHSESDFHQERNDSEFYSDIEPENDYPSNEAVVAPVTEPTVKSDTKSDSFNVESSNKSRQYDPVHFNPENRVSFLEAHLETRIQILDKVFKFLSDNPEHRSLLTLLKKDPVVDILNFKIIIPTEIIRYLMGYKTIQEGLKIIEQIDIEFLLRLKRIPQILKETNPILNNFHHLIDKLQKIKVVRSTQFTMQNIIIGQFDLQVKNLRFISEVSTTPSYKILYRDILCIPVIIQHFTIFSGIVRFDIDVQATFTTQFYIAVKLKSKTRFKKRLEMTLKKQIYNYLCELLRKFTSVVELFTTMDDFLFRLFRYFKGK